MLVSAAMMLMSPPRNTGPDHPLIRAVEAEPVEEASVEVLNFPQAGKGDDGDDNEFDELRSAVVFKRWFNVDQQKVCGGHAVMIASCVCDVFSLKKTKPTFAQCFLCSLSLLRREYYRKYGTEVCGGSRHYVGVLENGTDFADDERGIDARLTR